MLLPELLCVLALVESFSLQKRICGFKQISWGWPRGQNACPAGTKTHIKASRAAVVQTPMLLARDRKVP